MKGSTIKRRNNLHDKTVEEIMEENIFKEQEKKLPKVSYYSQLDTRRERNGQVGI